MQDAPPDDVPRADAPPAISHDRLMQALQAEHALRGLSARLSVAAARPQGPAAAAQALAVLAPEEGAAWLVEEASTARGALSRGDRGYLLETLAAQAAARADAALARQCARAAARHPEAATPECLATLSITLPAGELDAEAGALLRRLLDRHPAHPGLLRATAEILLSSGDGARAHDILTRLGRADPSPATVEWVMASRARLPDAFGPRARVAVLSTFTIDPVRPFLDVELRAAGMVPEIYVAPFDAWEREVRDPASGLRAFDPHAVCFALAADDLLPELAGAPAPDALRAAGAQAVDRITAAVAALRAWSPAAALVHSFVSAWPDPLGPAAAGGDARGRILAELDARLAGQLFDFPDTWLLDLEEVLARRADGAMEDPRLRHLARMRLGPRVLPEVARAWTGYLAPLRGATKKCVVLDLDDTLWGGVVGEEGARGIRLGEQSPGSEFVELQRWLATLPPRGILLAAVSKNNEADAMQVLRKHDAMVLRPESFAAMRINWLPKHENVAAIAGELGIATDAIVFVDDNPDERALMRRMLPEVLTVELPADPSGYRAALESLPQLRTLRLTAEDRARAGAYAARREREQARPPGGSMHDYLRSLEIRARVAPLDASTLPRVAQLFERTNQFNLTTRRHDAAFLRARAASPAWRMWTLRAADRFSDHGLVGAALARVEGDVWTVESLLLSCRAIGFGLETALLATVAAEARAGGAAVLCGEFAPTEKNRPAADFWARHGFAPRGTADGVETWVRDLEPPAVEVPEWIQMENDDAS
ncbi:MAG TPA: HAD-IIIC family phosphatase [Longimicrobium sp.]|nr:HAD-IIIC family phosphatase [Longimicrobium sp.]